MLRSLKGSDYSKAHVIPNSSVSLILSDGLLAAELHICPRISEYLELLIASLGLLG